MSDFSAFLFLTLDILIKKLQILNQCSLPFLIFGWKDSHSFPDMLEVFQATVKIMLCFCLRYI